MIKTTLYQFNLFCEEFNKCLELFGLMGWTVAYHYEKLTGENESSWAQVGFNWEQQSIRVWFNTEIDYDLPISDKEVIETAQHECAHALVYPLSRLADIPYAIDNTTVCAEEHKVINVILRLMKTGKK